MKNSYFSQKKMAVAVALTTALTAAPSLMAEDSSEGENSAALEEVLVLGIRGSLERSMDMKRDKIVGDRFTARPAADGRASRYAIHAASGSSSTLNVTGPRFCFKKSL